VEPLTYTVVVSATGSDATGVQFSDGINDANLTLVGGSLTATPVTIDDTYPQTVTANMSVNTATSGYSVVANDFSGISGGVAVPPSSLTITAFDATSAHSGTVTMTTSGANVGRFTYTPAPGYTGPDTFTYTISNGIGGATADRTATVHLTVSGPVIWFVDTATGSDANNGTLGHQQHRSHTRHLPVHDHACERERDGDTECCANR
jgi:Bacterial Ig domain